MLWLFQHETEKMTLVHPEACLKNCAIVTGRLIFVPKFSHVPPNCYNIYLFANYWQQ